MNYFYFCSPFDDLLKKEHYIGILIKAFILVVGLPAVFIYSSNDLIQEKIEDSLSGMDLNEEGEDTAKDSKKTIFLPDYLVSTSSFQIHVDLIKTVLNDIPFISEIKCPGESVPEYRITSYFKVLFNYIIGPNAP